MTEIFKRRNMKNNISESYIISYYYFWSPGFDVCISVFLAIASKSKVENWHRGPSVFGWSLSGRSAGHHKQHVLGQDGLIKTRSGLGRTGTRCTLSVTSALLWGGRGLQHRLVWAANAHSRQTCTSCRPNELSSHALSHVFNAKHPSPSTRRVDGSVGHGEEVHESDSLRPVWHLAVTYYTEAGARQAELPLLSSKLPHCSSAVTHVLLKKSI